VYVCVRAYTYIQGNGKPVLTCALIPPIFFYSYRVLTACRCVGLIMKNSSWTLPR